MDRRPTEAAAAIALLLGMALALYAGNGALAADRSAGPLPPGGKRGAWRQAEREAASGGDVKLAADSMRFWTERDVRYFLLEGDCLIEQGRQRIAAHECLAWMREVADPSEPVEIHLHARGNVRVGESSSPTM